MLSVRWRKVWRDLSAYRSKVVLTSAAVGIGLFAIMAVLVAYTVLSRELARGYTDTRPATATIFLDQPLDEAGLAAVRQAPGVEAIEPRRTYTGRVRVNDGEWSPLVLFIVDDMTSAEVSRFQLENGARPPEGDEVLVERSGIPVIGAAAGGLLTVSIPGEAQADFRLVGEVYDPAQAPGWMDGVVNAYAETGALERLNLTPDGEELRVILNNASDIESAETAARAFSSFLSEQGLSVARIEVPPPGKHPHEAQMNALLGIVAAFGLFALLLAGVLSATVVRALLGQQIKQIGVLKAIGAGPGQVIQLYLVFVSAIVVLATAISIPLGYLAGQVGARWAAEILNFEINDAGAPLWTVLATAALGFLLPLALAYGPVRRGARITVREALANPGASDGTVNFASRLNKISHLPRAMSLGLSNAFRRPGRLAMAVLLLAVAGGVFMTAFNVARSWEATLDAAFEGRRYDVEVSVDGRLSPSDAEEIAGTVPGIAALEAWSVAEVLRIHPGETDVANVYPGAVHGGLTLIAPPLRTSLLDLPLVEGRRLSAADQEAAVVNRKLLAEEPDLGLGSFIALRVGGQERTFEIVGLVDEPGAPPTVIVTPDAMACLSDEGAITSLRATFDGSVSDNTEGHIAELETALADLGDPVRSSLLTDDLRTSFDSHIAILVTALLGMAALIALVGGFGLASTLGLNLMERTREFGVLQAIGARPRDIFHIIESEGVTLGLMSAVAAFVISVPLTHGLAHIGGHVGIGRSLDIRFDPWGMMFWVVLVLVLGAFASAFPARRASRMTVREILSYE